MLASLISGPSDRGDYSKLPVVVMRTASMIA